MPLRGEAKRFQLGSGSDNGMPSFTAYGSGFNPNALAQLQAQIQARQQGMMQQLRPPMVGRMPASAAEQPAPFEYRHEAVAYLEHEVIPVLQDKRKLTPDLLKLAANAIAHNDFNNRYLQQLGFSETQLEEMAGNPAYRTATVRLLSALAESGTPAKDLQDTHKVEKLIEKTVSGLYAKEQLHTTTGEDLKAFGKGMVVPFANEKGELTTKSVLTGLGITAAVVGLGFFALPAVAAWGLAALGVGTLGYKIYQASQPAEAEVKVVEKDGRQIIVEDYRSDDKEKAYQWGGVATDTALLAGAGIRAVNRGTLKAPDWTGKTVDATKNWAGQAWQWTSGKWQSRPNWLFNSPPASGSTGTP